VALRTSAVRSGPGGDGWIMFLVVCMNVDIYKSLVKVPRLELLLRAHAEAELQQQGSRGDCTWPGLSSFLRAGEHIQNGLVKNETCATQSNVLVVD